MSLDDDVKMIYRIVEKMDLKIDKIQETQTEQGIVLAENTLIVKQHEQRSTKLEEWVSKIHGIYIALEEKFNALTAKVSSIEKSEEKVTAHISKINSYLNIFKSIPSLIKFLLLVIVFVSSVFGVFKFFYKG